MANLTAVLRKTIDGLPNATPQLRAKVYEKARAAITRQIQAADPPLADHVVEARYRVLEDAIQESEAHYLELEGGPAASDVAPAPTEPARPEAEPVSPSRPPVEPAAPSPPPVAEERPVPPPFPRATPTIRPASPVEAAPPASEPAFRAEPRPPREGAPARPAFPAEPRARMAPDETPRVSDEPKVGEIGPVVDAPSERDAAAERMPRAILRPASAPPAPAEDRRAGQSPGAMLSGIPEADVAAPRYPARRAKRRNSAPLVAGAAVVGILGLGALGFVYLDDIRDALLGSSTQVASVPATQPGQTTDTGETPAATDGATPEVATPPAGAPADTAPGAGTGGRQFTQRLLPDGSEVDEGPGPNAPNAFEEGTDVAQASIQPAEAVSSPPADAPPATAAATPEPPTTNASPPATASATVPVGQRAVFYEERSADREGTQQGGNVVWSVISEAPADGQPPEPAIRAVADVQGSNLRMTLTIRRNADATLPASHVIELMFDTPAGFPGGQIENVQRLALKPTEQARGEPLIGVAGKISDGFFIIALNDLPQAVESNLGLLGREEWIDIPIAYTSGQRALMSIEKGIPGDRVFKEALDAWAARRT
ncbi:hypothetical protein [Aureimonas sp. ME7]|uniref:hypothetical protein n=1 Tax=Aureimonas sp. ME7 TaxID=2744252 RepID=UPI0015F3A973|nr:hypothetical protein [Aureimonas sp. ME7]